LEVLNNYQRKKLDETNDEEFYSDPKFVYHLDANFRQNLSNIYKREEFRHKSLISGVVTGGIFGLGSEGYILAIISLQKTLQNENR